MISRLTAGLFAMAVSTLAVSAAPARADDRFLDQRDPDDVRDAQQAARRANQGGRRWYGPWLLGADLLPVALVIGAVAPNVFGGGDIVVPLFYSAYVGWTSAGPIVHLVHKNYWSAAWSGVMRLAVPLVTGWLAATATRESYSCHSEAVVPGRCEPPDTMGAFVLGMAAWVIPLTVIDAALLATR